ncbi:lipid droplet-associated perilipin protein [Heliocybe sulcata]|uniref:Lipid droplet-associated perilipin protein n=1 Tax=Heliocybe sulcata TaxID=5364 RepID=A0A5C3N5B0_9AGAM|nr:lipid droplet-associated perilipin protein [Heliocybe sulcata]
MATETQTAAPPQLSIVNRLGSIPLIHDSLTTLHSTLASNAYTQRPFLTAQDLTVIAYHKIGEPLQTRLAPILVKADGYANKAVDVVESRYPYPFKTPTEDIVKDVKARSDGARDVATKTIDDRVKKPVAGVAQGIDQRFAPLVDLFELYVSKLHAQLPETPATQHPIESPTYQYQRAYALTVNLRDSIYVYSKEHLEQIESQSTLLQRAAATAQNISTTASSSYSTAQQKVHTLSDTMLCEIRTIQSSTAALPAHLQHTLHDLTVALSSTAHQLSGILTQDAPLSTKVVQIRETVQERVQPLLEGLNARVEGVLAALKSKKDEAEEKVEGQEKVAGQDGMPSFAAVVKNEEHVPEGLGSKGPDENHKY